LLATLAQRGHAVDDLRTELDYVLHLLASAESALYGVTASAQFARVATTGRA